MDKETLLSIGRPQRHCMNCKGPLDEIERHPSALKSEGERPVARYDFCPTCWEQLKDDAYDSFWLTRREVKARRMPKLTRRDRNMALRALFESLWDRRDSEDVDAPLYLLAHLLMKWKGLIWRENEIDAAGRGHVIFEDPASGERISVAEVEIPDQKLVEIQQEIEDFMRQFAFNGEEVAL